MPSESTSLLEPSAEAPSCACCSWSCAKQSASFATLVLLFILPPAASDFYLPSLPQIASDLDCDADLTRLTIQLNILCSGFAAPLIGKMSDKWGKKYTSLVLISIFTLATLLSALSPNIWMLMISRIVQGISEAVPVVVLASIRTYSDDPQERLKFFLFIQMAFPFVLMLAPSLGGLISAAITWRGAFLCLFALGIILLVMISLFFPAADGIAPAASESEAEKTEPGFEAPAAAMEEGSAVSKAGKMLGDFTAIFYQPSQCLLLLASAWPFCIMTLLLQSFSFALETHLLYSVSDTALYLAILPMGLLVSPLFVPQLLNCGAKVLHILAFGTFLTLFSAIFGTCLAVFLENMAATDGGVDLVEARVFIMPVIIVSFAMYTVAMGTIAAPLQAAYMDLAPQNVSGIAAGLVFFAQQVLPQVLSMAMGDWSIGSLAGYLYSVSVLQYIFQVIFWPLFAWFVYKKIELSEKPPPPPV